MTAMFRGCNSEPDSRMFYKADEEPKFLSRDAMVPIFGDEVVSSGRHLHFTCNGLE
jgi:hypothetical protein